MSMNSALEQKYELLRTVESGEVTEVLLLRDRETDEKRILKKVPAGATSDPLYRTAVREFALLKSEARRIDARPDSPAVLDVYEEDGFRYFLIEYRDKASLKAVTSYPSLGKILNGRYAVVRGVACGGFGNVYMARDLSLPGKYWAVKEMQEAEGAFEAVERSFRIEAEMLSTLEHPSIPRIVDFFVEARTLYLAMDYIQGETLRRMLDRLGEAGAFPEEQVLRWALALCDVLEYLHSRATPIVFRDLKPDNILITPDGELRLVDFGIAKVFQGPKSETTQYTLLTEGYAPPEQFMGKTEPRSDVYALGATLFHLVTGVHPKTAAPDFPPVSTLRPGVSPSLEAVIARALEGKIADRFPSVGEMKAELLRLEGRRLAQSHLEKARCAERGSDYLTAGFEYMKALELDSENEETLAALAACCEAAGFSEKAREHWRRLLSLTADEGRRSEILARVEALEKRQEAAPAREGVSPHSAGALEAPPRRRRALVIAASVLLILPVIVLVTLSTINRYSEAERAYNRGLLLFQAKKYDEALVYYDKALEKDSFASVWYGKGNVYAAQGKEREALDAFDRALGIDPRFSDAWRAKGTVLAAIGSHADAIACFDRALELEPGDGESLMRKGTELQALGRQKEALACLDRAVALDGRSGETWFRKGLLLRDGGKDADALAAFDKAVEVGLATAPVLVARGAALGRMGKLDEAIASFDRALLLEPRSVDALREKGELLGNNGRYREALACFDGALGIDGRSAPLWLRKGQALDALGDGASALRCYDESLRLDAKQPAVWCAKGDLLVRAGKPADAAVCYDRSLALDGDQAGAWYGKGNALFGQARFHEALECFNRALRLSPGDRDVLRMKSRAVKALGK